MTESVLRSAADVTPVWLTEVLRVRGVLGKGHVVAVNVESSRPTLMSHTATIRLSYSPDCLADVPSRLFLKMTNDRLDPDWARHVGRGEVAFYRTVAPATSDPPVPRCYDAVFDEANGRFHILMEDLSETHRVVSEWPLPPTVKQCQQIVEIFARFHAAWWDDPRLGNGIGTRLDVKDVKDWVDRFGASFSRFADLLGDRLSKERRDRYERVLGASARLASRHVNVKNVTITHGDAHTWNVLYPRHAAGSAIRLIDWDNWRVRTATRDLAHMMAVHWYPERRRRLEATLLGHYHEILEECGVRGYCPEELRQDYRQAVIEHLALPVFQAMAKLPPPIWWGHLERVMLAFEDLGCDELL